MAYGYFDVQNKEYVITRPDTPSPWINYLGNGGFGGIISNNAGGLIFDGDPGKRRLTRYRHNTPVMDRPGRYIYIRDMHSGEYWSPTWQPVLKTLDKYECRHGLSYTTISSEYDNIAFEATYFVPFGTKHELWKCKIKNNGKEKRTLKLFPYVEFSWFEAAVDLTAEWGRYGMNCVSDGEIIVYNPASVEFIGEPFFGYFATTLKKDGYDCERDVFLGAYRSEANPIAVEKGECFNSHIDADNACAAFSCPVSLSAGEELEFIVTIGVTSDESTIEGTVREALSHDGANAALNQIKSSWDEHLNKLQINTPDEDMNKMINIWHAYQCRTTFDWSRFVSYYEKGVVRGWGFRDSMQDVLGVMHAMPDLAKERIKTLLSIQKSNGNARTVYFPGTKTSEGGGRSDDHLWSVYSVCSYIKESGDYAFLDEQVPYVDGGSGTVEEHLVRGLDFTRSNCGEHGIPRFLNSDWNDSICSIGTGGKSESAFVFFQAATAAKSMKELYAHIGNEKGLAWATDYYDWCKSLYKTLWDGKWFIRAYTSKGEKLGTDADEENKIFLNPQSWAVLSGLPTEEEANTAFDSVYKYLLCDYGLISHYPASSGFNMDKKTFFSMHRGVKENGGVFCHANTWAVIAESILNRGDEAYKIYKASIPCRRNDITDLSLTEPYVYGSAQIGPAHERYGVCSNSWLTGTASWMYYAVTRYILGIRPDYDGIVFDPCVPEDWNGYTVSRAYRGTVCNITVGKLPHKGAKPTSISVNGKEIAGSFMPYDMLKGLNEAEIKVNYN